MAWKKKLRCNKKESRLSRIVSDLQQPKMSESSLVVATGFPTSLVDLFVKNRARLKKPRNKKSSKTRPDQVDDLVISDPVVVSCSRDLGLGDHGEEEVKVESVREDEVKVQSLSNDGNLGEVHCGGSGRKVGFGGLFGVILVLILGLGFKKMVFGVTLSAFALMLLDCCCGRWLRLLLEPCIGLVRRVLGLVWWFGREKEKVEEERDGDGLVSDGEIQVVKCGEEEREVVGGELELEYELEFAFELDLVGCEESIVEECVKGKSKVGKIRRKIVKNLVPKKLRSRAKKRKMKRKEKELEFEIEAFDCPGGSRGKVQVSQNYEGDVEDEEESSRNGSISEDGYGIGSCSFTEELQPEKGTTVPVDEEVRVPAEESKRNYGYGIVLLVLAGLVGGRIAAFLLTVGLCLVLKLVKRWRRPLLIVH